MYLCGLMTPFCRHSCEFVRRVFLFSFFIAASLTLKENKSSGSEAAALMALLLFDEVAEIETRWVVLVFFSFVVVKFWRLANARTLRQFIVLICLLFWFFTPYLSWFQVGRRQDRRGFSDLFAAAVADTQVNASFSGSVVLSKVMCRNAFHILILSWTHVEWLYLSELFIRCTFFFFSLFNFNWL